MRILKRLFYLEKQRWREVLKSILVCIKYLASQNLVLRGHEERYGDTTKNHNKCSVLTFSNFKSWEKSGVLGIQLTHTLVWEGIREYSVIRKPRVNYSDF